MIAWFPGLRYVCFEPYKLKDPPLSSLHSFWTHLASIPFTRAYIIQPLEKKLQFTVIMFVDSYLKWAAIGLATAQLGAAQTYTTCNPLKS
jgi:hypothetical protein